MAQRQSEHILWRIIGDVRDPIGLRYAMPADVAKAQEAEQGAQLESGRVAT